MQYIFFDRGEYILRFDEASVENHLRLDVYVLSPKRESWKEKSRIFQYKKMYENSRIFFQKAFAFNQNMCIYPVFFYKKKLFWQRKLHAIRSNTSPKSKNVVIANNW